MTQQDHINHVQTQRGRAAIYARPAAGARTQTTQQQTNTLIELANEQGYPNEQIIVYEDVGVSARRPLAKRDALSDLLTAITQGGQEMKQDPIKAIYVSSEHRFFSYQSPVDLAHFMTVCADHHVVLLTPTATYDFSTPDQIALFRLQCEQAAHYIAEQVGKLTQASQTRGSAAQKPEEE